MNESEFETSTSRGLPIPVRLQMGSRDYAAADEEESLTPSAFESAPITMACESAYEPAVTALKEIAKADCLGSKKANEILIELGLDESGQSFSLFHK